MPRHVVDRFVRDMDGPRGAGEDGRSSCTPAPRLSRARTKQFAGIGCGSPTNENRRARVETLLWRQTRADPLRFAAEPAQGAQRRRKIPHVRGRDGARHPVTSARSRRKYVMMIPIRLTIIGSGPTVSKNVNWRERVHRSRATSAPATLPHGGLLACGGWPSHSRGALPQSCQDLGRFGGTPGDGRARPHGWNVVTDKDLLPEVPHRHQLRESRGSGSNPAAPTSPVSTTPLAAQHLTAPPN